MIGHFIVSVCVCVCVQPFSHCLLTEVIIQQRTLVVCIRADKRDLAESSSAWFAAGNQGEVQVQY